MNFGQKDHEFNDHQMRMAAARIIVGNISTKVTKGDLDDKFSKYGKILDVEMHKTHAYVQFEREDNSVQAMKNESGTLFKGNRIEITHEMDRNGSFNRGGPRSSPPPGNRFGPGFGRDARDRSPIRDQYDGGFRKDDRFIPRPEFDDMRRFPGRRFEEDSFKYRLDPKEEMMRGAYIPSNPLDGRRHELPGTQQCNDCEIIVLNKQHRDYAESVERRLKGLGLTVDLMFLVDEMALARTIRDIARRGTLYAVIIGRQHEMHLSVTLNILHDNPQEHRNMPLEDALKLMSRNFQEYVQKKRERVAALDKAPSNLPPLEREIQLILNTLADNKYVTLSELEKVIIHLQEHRDRMKAAEAAKAGPKEELNSAEQQDLQQRILSIINQSGGDIAKSSIQAPLPVPPPAAILQSQQQQASPFLNLDLPNVQKALDSLIQTPNLLQSISFASALPLANASAQAMAQNSPLHDPMNRANQYNSQAGVGQQPIRHPLLGTQVGGSNNYFAPRGSR